MKSKIHKNKKTVHIICLVFFILPFIALGGSGKNKKTPDPSSCLEISGKVSLLNAKKPGEVISVLLYKGNLLVDSVTLPATNSFKFVLEKNEEYAIKVIQKGFVPRLVSISTEIPEKACHNIFKFHFDLTPLSYEDINTKDTDALDFPIALVCYDAKKGYFDYREKYTHFIKEEISTKN